MGDRCYLEITLRRSDLDRFGKHLDAAPGAEWYDHLSEEEDCPGVVTASVHEANYAWFDERAEAARAGIPFYGRHDSGGEYGPYCFASWCGKKVRPERIAARPGWDAIPAVRNGRIVEIKSSLILQPGPAALTEGLDAICAALA